MSDAVTAEAPARSLRNRLRLSVALKIGLPLVLLTVLVAALLGYQGINSAKEREKASYELEAQNLAGAVTNEYQSTTDPAQLEVRIATYLAGTVSESQGKLDRVQLYMQGLGPEWGGRLNDRHGQASDQGAPGVFLPVR